MTDEWLWCMHCQRAFRRSELRGDKVQFCGYEECEGVAPHDMLRWTWVRGECPQYPEVPQRGTIYRVPQQRSAG